MLTELQREIVCVSGVFDFTTAALNNTDQFITKLSERIVPA